MKIDLSKLPEGTKWIAIDLDGDVYSFSGEPKPGILIPSSYYGDGIELIGNVHD